MNPSYTPPYEISDPAINLIAEIVDALTRLELGVDSGVLMHLRKDHQLRSIHTSLAIENNSVSLEQVTDVINGDWVHGDPREIQEVKNAFTAYSALASFKPFKVSNFLKAHTVMMETLRSLFLNDVSSAHPDGSMEILKVIWWKHNSPCGQYASAKVHRSLNVNSDGSYTLQQLEGLTPLELTPLEGDELNSFANRQRRSPTRLQRLHALDSGSRCLSRR